MKSISVDRPLVSVIIPVFNVEKYIFPCLDSLSNQTNQNFEVIIINDGSEDASMEVVERHLGLFKENQVKCLSIKNSGLSVARNTGISIASGNYILFLDSDDMLAINAIEKCLQALTSSNSNIVMFNSYAFYDETNNHCPRYSTKRTSSYGKSILASEYFVNSVKNKTFSPMAWSYMYERELLSTLKFEPGLIHEDNLFTVQMLLHPSTPRLTVIDDALYLYRIRDGSITTSKAKISQSINGCIQCANLMKVNILPKLSSRIQARALCRVISDLYYAALKKHLIYTGMLSSIDAFLFFYTHAGVKFLSLRSCMIIVLPNLMLNIIKSRE